MSEIPPLKKHLVPIDPLLFRGFSWIARRRLRGAFSALRVAHLDRLPGTRGALIFYLNHPSWWDPLTSIVLAPWLMGTRSFYAPIESEALKRYGIFRRLGLFPVEIASPRGAAQFLRAAEEAIAGGHVLGITAQGRFTDVRERPPGLKSGLGALLSRMERRAEACTAVPIALEYTFWNERTPEALASIGRPLSVSPDDGATGPRSAAEWTALLESALAETQDELAALARQRDPALFRTVLQGQGGVAGIYGWWKRFKQLAHKSSA